jgi:pimeloyl-ACP methyl ester carboxylesterase
MTTPDEGRIYWEWFGPEAGLPMLLTDGLACNGTFFVNQIPYFAQMRPVVRWAFRGHGLSDPPTACCDYTVATCIEDLFLLMDHLDIRQAIHVGYSMGVQLLLEAASRKPERFAAMSLQCGTWGHLIDSFHGNSIARTIFPALYSLVLNDHSIFPRVWRTVAPSRLVYFLTSLSEFDGRLVQREQLMPYLEHLASMDMEVTLTLAESAGAQDTRPLLPGIRIPTLVLGAYSDRFTPYYLSEEIYQGLRNAELCVVPGATHSVMLEQPDLVNLRVEDFLVRRVDGVQIGAAAVGR